MNGGIFTPGVEQARAGIYFRFTSAAKARLLAGERGTAALPFVLDWGPSKKFIEIAKDEDIKKKLGLDPSDPSLLLLQEARKRAKIVKLYRINEGTKAKGDIGTGVKATAKYGGARGNQLLVRISENVLDSTKKDVITFLSNKAVHRQTVKTAKDLQNNDWVDFSGSGELDLSAGVLLAGGTDVDPTNLDYTEYMEAAELEYFDTIGLPVDGEESEELKVTFASFIKRIRDGQGVKVTGVVPNFSGDHEGIINVVNGATLAEKQLTVAETVAWVTGAASSATVNQSLTFVEYDGAIGVFPEFDNDEIIERLGKGEFLLTYDPRDKAVSVESDINSLTTFTQDKNEKFGKNKFIRIIDAINNDVTRELKRTIKELKNSGKDIPANADGEQIVRTLVTIYMNELQNGGAIEGFDSTEDINISVTDKANGFLIGIGVKDVDSAEKFYFDVVAR
ncbi:phage tail sheath family protein [Peribacillus loiseleuriae]|uniref:phage tail sheath family protein n=1 Tax=Peribacillus loiseleuriae TaxID=1679170 RepID=UPI003CFCD268